MIYRRQILWGLCAFCVAQTAWAEDRFALVVGNSRYATVEALDNPVNDAELIAGKLE